MTNSDKSQPKWLTIGQASKYLGISRDTLRRWEKKGKIKAVRSPTNRRYYTQKQLNEIMNPKGAKAKHEKTRKESQSKLSSQVKLVLIGLASLVTAAILGFLVQAFVLK